MRPGRAASVGLVALAYVVGAGAALVVGRALAGAHPLLVVAVADVVATVAVFAFSVGCDNSSVYDPYWSVAPIAIAVYWTLAAPAGARVDRGWLVTVLVTAWGARLTWNWLRGWRGLAHEDWRYVDFRATAGRAYWAVSFLGIHLVPTLIVLAGCVSIWVATSGGRPLGPLDALATLVTAGALLLEATADQQLRRFRRSAPAPGATLRTGLWARSRHPNYLGETSFWWGLFLFALAADPSRWWAIAGPVLITLMFVFVSIPMIDRRMQARRPEYARVMREIPALVPRL